MLQFCVIAILFRFELIIDSEFVSRFKISKKITNLTTFLKFVKTLFCTYQSNCESRCCIRKCQLTHGLRDVLPAGHCSQNVWWGTRATSPRTHSTLLLLQNRVEWLFTLLAIFLNSDPVLHCTLSIDLTTTFPYYTVTLDSTYYTYSLYLPLMAVYIRREPDGESFTIAVGYPTSKA